MAKKTPDKKTKIKFSYDENDNTNTTMSSNEITNNIKKNLNTHDSTYDLLVKSVKPITIREDYIKNKSRNKVVFSSQTFDRQYDGVEHKTFQRLSDGDLKELAQVDPYISAIISTRSSQGQVIGKRSESKFDKGTRIVDYSNLSIDDFGSKDEFIKSQKIKEGHKKKVLEWVLNCGTDDDEIIDSAYAGCPDKTFKKCSLSEFLSSQIRNLLTFGRCGTQVFRDEDGAPTMFRPVPIETIFNVHPNSTIHVGRDRNTSPVSIQDTEEFNAMDEVERPIAYVQRVNGRNTNFFTEDELKVTYFQKQALFDLKGYPLAPIEQAIFMVFIHQNTLGYMRNQFIKGLGTKGVLSLEATDPSAELTAEDLDKLRREFHNFLSRTDNSSTTPVIAGPIRVNYIPLSSSPRDMEFLQIEEHVIRSLCSSMQISPQEMGYGHLSINQGGLTQSNKQEDIIQGEERGLRTILDVIYETINEIVFEHFHIEDSKMEVSYTGVGEDTRDSVISRGIQEMQTTATMNSLWADSEKIDNIPIGGDVPLSDVFHRNVIRYMSYGIFLENFFGLKGASKNPLYDFIIDPALNQAYQQKIMMTDNMTREQGELQLEQQKMELESMQMQTQMPQGAPMGDQGQPQEQPQGQEQGSEQEQSQEQQPEDMPKSLAEAYAEKQKLQKSLAIYFKEWSKIYKNGEND